MQTEQLRGIIPPMITPLLATNEIDINGLKNLVEHLISGGVHGIFILGTTGEAQHLSPELKKDLIVNTCMFVNGRVPVLVGITDTSFTESVHLSQIAAECNADGVVAAPPYYFSLGQPELYEYYDALATDSSLPLYLYNMPSHTKVMIEIDTVEKLARNKKIIGLKDSSANAVYFHKLMDRMKGKDFACFVGPEEMMASVVLMGANGGVAGGANLYPRLFVDLYEAAFYKNIDKVHELQAKMMAVGNNLYNIGRFGSSYIKGLKTALNLKGICSDILAQPFHSFLDPEKEKIRQALLKLESD